VNGDRVAVAVAAAAAGYALAALFVSRSIRDPDRDLMRINVRGTNVPAVLGLPIAAAGLVVVGLVVVAGIVGLRAADAPRMSAAVAVVTVVMAAAGRYDDRRGDESVRGFGGHVKAAASGKLTGGAVKIAAGAAAGIAAGTIVADGRAIFEVGAVVALTANFINLTDRAPGRAGKVTLIMAAPLAALGTSSWTIAAAGVLGALVYSLRLDLREEAMLGDAGANSLGGVVGLGLAASLGETARLIALALLVAVNLASERWSFSRVIEATPFLARVDRWGRRAK
jgi:UDP-GlcNAc:undecaprenyl-phosphate GlcNAc-1-phosphate transferase